jgi:hypothetical protein
VPRRVQGEFQRGERAMGKSNLLTTEERPRLTELQDLLLDRYVEQNEALEEGKKDRAMAIEFEIKELKREMEEIKEWANV